MSTKKSPKCTNEFKQTIINLYYTQTTADYRAPMNTLCRVLMVNRSTYYKFLNHTPSARDKDNAYLRSCIIAKRCRTFFLFMRYS